MFQVNNKNTQKGFELGSNFKKKKEYSSGIPNLGSLLLITNFRQFQTECFYC